MCAFTLAAFALHRSETQVSVETGNFVPLDLDVDLSQHLDDLMLDETDDEDEPVLRWKDGRLVDTWREGYPYDERMPRPDYEAVKRLLQIELLRLQNWVKDNQKRSSSCSRAVTPLARGALSSGSRST